MSRSKRKRISHARLLRLVRYDPATGKFAALVSRGGVRDADHLGSLDPNGYRRIMIERRKYSAGPLAWFYTTGKWSKWQIDHRDLNKDNNAWDNLREASGSLNHANTRQPRGTRAPLKGAHWNRFRGHWQSYIRVNGKSIRLGRFESAEEAHAAYVEAARRAFGEFARAA